MPDDPIAISALAEWDCSVKWSPRVVLGCGPIESRADYRNPELWREEPHGMRVTRFDRCNLHGPNIDSVVEFSTQVLDFSLTEAAETPNGIVAAFLSCSNKAHDVAFIRRPEPAKFHHVAFSLDSWHEVGQAADIIAAMTSRSISARPGMASPVVRRSTSLIVWEPQ